MKFNINEYVRVRLTERGKEIILKQHKELSRSIPSIGEFVLPKEDADGWSEWQMWQLMQTFGAHLYLGGESPFHTEIEIP